MNLFEKVDFRNTKKGKMLMVYGPPGSGKSTFASMLAAEIGVKQAHTVVIDFEIGMRDALVKAECDKTELYDLSDPTSGMGLEIAKFLRNLRDREEVKLVVLDTLSEMCWSLLRGICGTKQATLPMYGERKRQLKEILVELRNLTKSGKHVLVLTHQTVGEVEGLPGYYAPEAPKNDRADVVGQFDFVGRMQVATKAAAEYLGLNEGERFIDYRQDPQQVSKCRFDMDPEKPYVFARNEDDARTFINALT
jgi:adenosyl cobinamide kinase/adenosyl cobinamide phosphate guanylyltransferase